MLSVLILLSYWLSSIRRGNISGDPERPCASPTLRLQPPLNTIPRRKYSLSIMSSANLSPKSAIPSSNFGSGGNTSSGGCALKPSNSLKIFSTSSSRRSSQSRKKRTRIKAHRSYSPFPP
ncbi:unnamed protein product [Allacma fusca]|uniref:Uncharacterized protein n=1 Tax=Allacma fusca TaxID=39272 RepID=A0A8J2PNT4_9HEXA|nr:unnamed protein product [Allacma fusca]